MKTIAFFTFLFASFSLNAQIGVNVESPQSMLDIQGTPALPPVKIQNLTQKNVSQPVLLLINDDNEVVSSITRYYPIVYKSIQSQTGLDLPYTSNSVLYQLDSPPTGFTIVDDLTTSIEINNQRGDNNVLNIDLSGVAQFNSNNAITNNTYFDFEIGIFVNDQLKAIRRYSLTGDGFIGAFTNFDLKGVIADLENGNYEIKIGFLSKSSNSSIPLSIGKASTAFTGNYLKNDIVNLKLHIYGVYF